MDKEVFQCDSCDKEFYEERYLQQHLSTVHNHRGPKFKCKDCGETFSRHYQLKHHAKTNHDHVDWRSVRGMYACNLCEESFEVKSALTSHERTFHQTFKCDMCDRSFSQNALLLEHRKSVHKKKISDFACPDCGVNFDSKRLQQKHMQTYHNQRKFKCTSCIVCFSNQDDLDAHCLMEHVNKKTFRCEICPVPKEYKHFFHWKKHHREKHGEVLMHVNPSDLDNEAENEEATDLVAEEESLVEAEPEVPLEVPEERPKKLRKEKAGNDDTRDYSCTVCGESYQTLQEALAKHKNNIPHRYSEPKFKCELCDRRFNYSYRLQEHRKSAHKEDRTDITCLECGMTFDKPSLLRKHQMSAVHNPQTQFKCSVCVKCFPSKEHMIAHHKSEHIERKVFKCDLCRQEYKHFFHLRRHIKLHHPNTFVCKVCSAEFTQPHLLQQHHDEAHGEPIVDPSEVKQELTEVLVKLEEGDEPIEMETDDSEDEADQNEQMIKQEIDDEGFLNVKVKEEPPEIEDDDEIYDETLEGTLEAGGKQEPEVSIKTEEEENEESITAAQLVPNNISRRGPKRTGRLYSCRICKLDFARAKELKVHRDALHISYRNITCSLCGESFKSNSSFNYHLKYGYHKNEEPPKETSKEEKDYKCDRCAQVFSHEFKLKQHKSKRCLDTFTCRLCGRHFETLSSLSRHTLIFHEGRAYNCENCNQVFEHYHLLKMHNLHKHKLIFDCTVCGTQFRRSSDLAEHKRNAHNIRKFKCSRCGIDYNRFNSIVRHLRRVHGVKEINSENQDGVSRDIEFIDPEESP